MQTDPRNFSRPMEFIPERRDDNPKAFLAFSAGQFLCVGKQLAYQEMRLFLGRLVGLFDFRPGPGFNCEAFGPATKFKGTLLIPAIPVIVEERK